jgi:uncharacterized protein
MVGWNPFITDVPLAPQELIDRETEWRQMVERAEGGHNTRLSAPRRYGKTTLLRKVEQEADLGGMSTVYVDFFGVLSLDEMLVRVEAAYERGLKGPVAQWFAGVRRRWRPTVRVGTPEASVDVQPLPEADASRALHEVLDLPRRIFEREGQRTLVLFDEFQAVLGAGEGVDGLIRSRIQHHRDAASYVFAGSHPGLMAELFGTRERPLYGQSRPVVLGPLEDEDLAVYIAGKFSETGREIGAAIDPLLAMVRGHPQRAMLMAHHVWEVTERGSTADEAAWANALGTAFSELHESFERAWDDYSTNERRVMAATAWTGPWGAGTSLYAKSTLERFRLAKGTARDVRAALLRRGELERAGRNGVRIVDPLLEAWIASGRRPRT